MTSGQQRGSFIVNLFLTKRGYTVNGSGRDPFIILLLNRPGLEQAGSIRFRKMKLIRALNCLQSFKKAI
jgi:hypothetical protein